MSRVIVIVPVELSGSIKVLERNRPKCAAVSVGPLANGELTGGQAR